MGTALAMVAGLPSGGAAAELRLELPGGVQTLQSGTLLAYLRHQAAR
ncbi:hypothetical protein NON00_05700 [Roseomonas sp. GC11]|nr:hypothetical protein [Roseomonas sp. GC11]MCQ4159416.1 hypothetical protein [Roseomonas sp. GC11]